MPVLVDLKLPIDPAPPPGDVRAFLREAERRVARFTRDHHIPGFVPCDFAGAYRVLRALTTADLAPGNLFCEWGSGFGVVACLAAMLDLDACGIEANGELVEAARRLAADFELPVSFAHGSFLPAGEADLLDADGFVWLATDEASAEDELGLGPDDFDVIFAYPWPDEESVVEDVFARRAAVGAILITYHGGEDWRLRRKTGDNRETKRPQGRPS